MQTRTYELQSIRFCSVMYYLVSRIFGGHIITSKPTLVKNSTSTPNYRSYNPNNLLLSTSTNPKYYVVPVDDI